MLMSRLRTDARTHGRTECEDRARILKQNSQFTSLGKGGKVNKPRNYLLAIFQQQQNDRTNFEDTLRLWLKLIFEQVQ